MIHDVLTRIGGIGVYGVISIALFFAGFVGIVIWTLCLKRTYVNTMRELPLEPDPESRSNRSASSQPDSPHD